MKKTPCGTAVLLIVLEVDLYGWYRTLAKVLTCLGLPLFVGHGLGTISRVVFHHQQRTLRSQGFTQALLLDLYNEQTWHTPPDQVFAAPSLPIDGLAWVHAAGSGIRSKVALDEGSSDSRNNFLTSGDVAVESQNGKRLDECDAQANHAGQSKGQACQSFELAINTALPLSPRGTIAEWMP